MSKVELDNLLTQPSIIALVSFVIAKIILVGGQESDFKFAHEKEWDNALPNFSVLSRFFNEFYL